MEDKRYREKVSKPCIKHHRSINPSVRFPDAAAIHSFELLHRMIYDMCWLPDEMCREQMFPVGLQVCKLAVEAASRAPDYELSTDQVLDLWPDHLKGQSLSYEEIIDHLLKDNRVKYKVMDPCIKHCLEVDTSWQESDEAGEAVVEDCQAAIESTLVYMLSAFGKICRQDEICRERMIPVGLEVCKNAAESVSRRRVE